MFCLFTVITRKIIILQIVPVNTFSNNTDSHIFHGEIKDDSQPWRDRSPYERQPAKIYTCRYRKVRKRDGSKDRSR